MLKIVCLVFLSVQTFGLPDFQIIQNVNFQDGTHHMTLTTGDLKRFSGHALQLIQNKCPKVKSSVIFDLNKFIGKVIAKDSNPVPGNDENFSNLMKSVTTCSSQVNTSPLSKIKETSGHESAGDDIVKLIFSSSFEDKSADHPVTPENSHSTESKDSISPIWVTWTEITSPENVEEIRVLEDEGPIEKILGTKDETTPSISTPLSVSDVKISATSKPKPEVPNEEKSPFVKWVSEVIADISEFFKNVFGGRQRRSTQRPLGNEMFENETMASASLGEKGFKKLFDEACRIYCEKCNGPLAPYEFKTASAEVLDYLFKIMPRQRLDLAASYHLTEEFMQSVQECE